MLRKINILIALTLLIIGGLEAQNHSDKIIANLQKPASNDCGIEGPANSPWAQRGQNAKRNALQK